MFDLTNFLASRPVTAFLTRFGINITENLERAREKSKIWDERIPLITDDNYRDIIVNEDLTPEEESQRVWFLVISVTSSKPEGLSKFVDEVFDTAFNKTQLAEDLPHIRWGRIDYLNVTALTTKWAVWQAPYLVVLKDRGQTLRFFRAHELRLKAEALRSFLQTDGWEARKPWSSMYAPGGSREYLMDYFATGMAKVYNLTVKVPSWLLFLLSGSLASLVLSLMHKSPVAAASSTTTSPPAVQAPVSPPSPSPASGGAKHKGAKQRKNGKK